MRRRGHRAAGHGGLLRQEAGRFAPSTSGLPHVGTLASALLVWLDARARGAPVILRLEDLDPQRARDAYADAIRAAVAHVGLGFDAVLRQSDHAAAHAAAVDALARQGRLYACHCSRADVARRQAEPAGAAAYDNACRTGPAVTPGTWQQAAGVLRLRLPARRVVPEDLGGRDLACALTTVGDPVIRRRDGSIAYLLASVIDDAASGVGHVVRGHDLAPITAVQVALMQLLGLPIPTYRHHLLLRRPDGQKYSKSTDGSSGGWGTPPDGPALCGRLAHLMGLQAHAGPTTPKRLLRHFCWSQVATQDQRVGGF